MTRMSACLLPDWGQPAGNAGKQNTPLLFATEIKQVFALSEFEGGKKAVSFTEWFFSVKMWSSMFKSDTTHATTLLYF